MSETIAIYSPHSRRLQLSLGILLLIGLLLPGTARAVCGTPPTVSFDSAAKYSAAGDYVDYTVSITNNHGSSCDVDLSIVSTDDAGFTSSIETANPVTVGAGATDTSTTLRVTVDPGTSDWLVNTTTFRVEAIDTDATTTVFDNNPLLHNSVNLNSSKHSGNWGSTKAGAKYGSFTCQTCHVQDTNNIKRVRTSITTPNDTFGSLPGDGMPIVFQSAEDGSADMGDDGRADQTQSDAICEVCHTYDASGANGVKYHGYDMSGPGDVGHYNQKDCISCHKHKVGFKASCASCHGGGTVGSKESNFWPDESTAAAENDQSGRHLEHMEVLAQMHYGMSATDLLNDADSATKQRDLCAYCHDTPGADGDHASASIAETAFHPAWNQGAAASGSYTTGDGNCTNICHNNKATGVGSYGWHDAGTSTCIMCHNDMTNSGNTTGETHADHTNASTNFGRSIVCADCHHSDTNWGSNTPPGTNHIDGDFDLGGVVTLSYTGSTPPGTSYGGCGTNACHNDGTGVGAPANAAYQWDDNGLSDCGICHATLPASQSHPAHVITAEDKYAGSPNPNWATNNSTVGNYDFGCGNCHGSTLSAHLNGSVSVSGVGYNSGSGQCSSNNCHQDGQGGAPMIAPTWGTPFTEGACNQCHGNFPTTAAHPQHTLEVGFHYDAIYSGLTDFLPVVDTDSYDPGLDDGDGNFTNQNPGGSNFDSLRGHGGALETAGATAIVSCNTCHSEVVTVNSNDLATYADANPNTRACSECHDDSVTATVGLLEVADKTKHLNGAVNVRFFDKKVRSKAQVRDENSYTVVPATAETNWTKTTELTNNWHRFEGYKAIDGSSYDEQPDTLHNMAVAYGGANYYDTGTKTCMISCHLWEEGRVDKIPVHWVDNATGGSAELMCIDCHTRLPK